MDRERVRGGSKKSNEHTWEERKFFSVVHDKHRGKTKNISSIPTLHLSPFERVGRDRVRQKSCTKKKETWNKNVFTNSCLPEVSRKNIIVRNQVLHWLSTTIFLHIFPFAKFPARFFPLFFCSSPSRIFLRSEPRIKTYYSSRKDHVSRTPPAIYKPFEPLTTTSTIYLLSRYSRLFCATILTEILMI